MYCIFHLARTGSHNLHHMINASMVFQDPRHHGTKIEPFNPAFHTDDSVEKEYNNIINNDPPRTVKLTVWHYPWLADRFLQNNDYKTIFIKPQNYRKRLLKALVEKQLGTYSNGSDRKSSREPYTGRLKFTDDLIAERFEHYKIHMLYETKCDYVFYDEYIFENPSDVLNTLGLSFIGSRYKRTAPFYSDEQMLDNVDSFNEQYDRLSFEMFGIII